MRIHFLILSIMLAIAGFTALQAGGDDCREREAEEAAKHKLECTVSEYEGTVTCTKNPDGSVSVTLTCGDKVIFICNKCEACKKLVEKDGQTVKLKGRYLHDKRERLCISDCEDCSVAGDKSSKVTTK